MLWDTAGQEEFDAITKAYYRGTYNAKTSSWSSAEVKVTPTPHNLVLEVYSMLSANFTPITTPLQWNLD